MEYNVEEISNKIKKKKKIINSIQIIIIVLLIMLFIINTFIINYDQDLDEPSNFLELYVFDIVSKSMVPTLEENDIIIVKNTNDVKEGDIIVFRKEKKIISHRIIKTVIKSDGVKYITKGDNNETQDDFEVSINEIYGKVIYRIPKVGKTIRYLHEKNGLEIIIICVVVIFLIYNIRSNRKNIRKKKRWKYDTKKKREKYN